MNVPLKERMNSATAWVGEVATRPLNEFDYERANWTPEDGKRLIDGWTCGTSYLVRHSRRNLEKGLDRRALWQALLVPVAATAAVPLAPLCFFYGLRPPFRLSRPKDSTREDTIAYELRYIRETAELLACDEQFRLLQKIHGTTPQEVMAWADASLSINDKVCRDVALAASRRVRCSRLIKRRAQKTAESLKKLRRRHDPSKPPVDGTR